MSANYVGTIANTMPFVHAYECSIAPLTSTCVCCWKVDVLQRRLAEAIQSERSLARSVERGRLQLSAEVHKEEEAVTRLQHSLQCCEQQHKAVEARLQQEVWALQKKETALKGGCARKLQEVQGDLEAIRRERDALAEAHHAGSCDFGHGPWAPALPAVHHVHHGHHVAAYVCMIRTVLGGD